jgi:hypothetical protein
MTDLIHQIVEIAKSIAHIFDANLLEPLTQLAKGIGNLFVKVLELAVMIVKWIFAKI